MKRWYSLGLGVLLFCVLVITCLSPASARDPGKELQVKILAINDFHGHLSNDGLQGKGSAPVLAAYLQAAAQGLEGQTFIVHAGDQVGASPAASALLQDEPAIMFLNILATRQYPNCNLIGTLGNHEFDQGREEMLRLIRGGNHQDGPFLEKPYGGARFPYVCANVMNRETGQTLLPPYVIKEVKGIRLAFIGAVTTETPSKIANSEKSRLLFFDETEAINYQVKLLKKLGIRAIVVLLHQGGEQEPYDGPTKDPLPKELRVADDKFLNLIQELDDEVDVVVSGHSHNFTNAYIKNRNKKEILVTRAYWHGEAYGEIDLKIDPDTKDVVDKKAQIKFPLMDAGPGLHPDPQVSHLVKQADALAEKRFRSMVKRDIKDPIGTAAENIKKKENGAIESPLGNLVADAYREAGQSHFAFVNLGGIRADLIPAGNVTWRILFSVQPFRNKLVKMSLKKDQIYKLLEQQWADPNKPKFLQISGLSYKYTDNPFKIVELNDASGETLKEKVYYTVTVNTFLSGGGDEFTLFNEFKDVKKVELNVTDFVALVDYIKKIPQLYSSKGRITKIEKK